MRIALLSDIHDHTTHLLLALQVAGEHGCTHLLFMGDMAGITTFRTLREEWPHGIDLVFGNNEYERTAFRDLAARWSNTTLHGDTADLRLAGRRIFITHLPWTAAEAARSGRYDAVFFGHTHTPEQFMLGDTLVVNPGEIYGRQGTPSIGVYDTETNAVRIITI